MPMSDVNDKMVKQHVESLKLLTFLDISYCLNITCDGLQALGQHCTSLFHLRRNMPPPVWQKDIGAVASDTDDREALAIADTMQGLHHLELGYGCLTDIGLDAIFTKCKNLTHLDIIGCYAVKMESDHFEDRCQRLEGFRAPWDDEFEDEDESDGSAYNDYYSDSDDA